MKLLSRRLIFVGALAVLVSGVLAMIGTDFSRLFSSGSMDQQSQRTGHSSFMPLERAVFAASAPQAQLLPGQMMAGDAFENVTVLDGMPVDEFMGTMGLFSAALSYCCGDCHTRAATNNPDWADDPPAKRTARAMVDMVNRINNENFGGLPFVTCWTCHRGDPKPRTTADIDTVYGYISLPPAVLPVAPAGAAPPVDEVFDAYLEALGGEERVAAITSYTATGTGLLFGNIQAEPADIYAGGPDRHARVIHASPGDFARNVDGEEAWVTTPSNSIGQYQLHDSAMDGMLLEAQLSFPAGIQDFFSSWSVNYPTTLNGRLVNVVSGTTAEGLLATFYFDRETGLLTRVAYFAETGLGLVPTQFDFSDYRSVDGVLMPFEFTYGHIGNQEMYVLENIETNVQIDAAMFARPQTP